MKSKHLLWILPAALVVTSMAFAERETPPAGGEPKDFNLPEKTTFTLDNGLGVTLVQYGSVPKVNAAFIIRAGNAFESDDETWLADITADFLKEGTATKGNAEIAQEAARIGGSVNTNTGADQTTVSGDALAEFAPDLVALLSEMVQTPSFPEGELERLKNDYLRILSIQRTQPQALAQEKFRSLLYPDHPYGRPFPSEEMIAAFDIARVRSFYDANYGARRAHLYVVGVFDERKVERLIREELSGWREGTPVEENIPEPVTERAVHLIGRPGAPQSTIIVGCPVIDPSHPDYVSLQVMNTMLGGSFSSRMTSNLREDKGYTYSPFSQVSSRYRDAYWAQQADVTTQVTGASLKEMFYEINRLQSEAPTSEELEAFQNYMAGVFVLQNGTRNGIIQQLSFLALHGLDDSYLTDYVQHVYAVTPAKVQEMAQTYLNDDQMTMVVVGDVSKIRGQVSSYGPVAMAH
jgi:predicted Zn-dependent peptidase